MTVEVVVLLSIMRLTRACLNLFRPCWNGWDGTRLFAVVRRDPDVSRQKTKKRVDPVVRASFYHFSIFPAPRNASPPPVYYEFQTT